jgi:hypothetical protein
MRRSLFIPAGIVAAFAALAPAARAGERITLRNGFDIRCDHHAVVDDRVRLYLTAEEDNYMDVGPDEITAVEFVPDPPAPPPSAEAAPTRKAMAPRETKLTEVDLGQMLAKAGQQHNLDVDLLASVVKAESGGNARAVSRAGARGLMQLMPSTASDLGVSDSFKPEEHVSGGSIYLDWLLTRYHDNLSLALAAYNAGPAAVDKYHGIPPYHETKVYVARVIREFNRRVHARAAQAKLAQVSAVASAGSTGR